MNKFFKALLVVGFLLSSSGAFAVNSCGTKVIKVLEWPGKCNQHVAFILDGSGGKWICSVSNRSDTLIIAALTAELPVVVKLGENSAATCADIDHYHVPDYLSVAK